MELFNASLLFFDCKIHKSFISAIKYHHSVHQIRNQAQLVAALTDCSSNDQPIQNRKHSHASTTKPMYKVCGCVSYPTTVMYLTIQFVIHLTSVLRSLFRQCDAFVQIALPWFVGNFIFNFPLLTNVIIIISLPDRETIHMYEYML